MKNKTTGQTGQAPDKTPAKKPPKKLTTERRRELIKDRILSNGPWNINKTALAEELKINRDTLYEDWKVIMEQVPPEDLRETEVHLGKVYKDVLDEVHSIALMGEDSKDRISAAKAAAQIGETFVRHLESFGRKGKVADKVELVGDDNLSDFLKMLDSRKEEKDGKK